MAFTNFHTGLSLREMIHEFKHQTLVLFKGLLLQPKVCKILSIFSGLYTNFSRCSFSALAVNVYA